MDEILYRGRLLVVLSTVSILTACIYVNHPPYPDTWGSPPSIADNVCADIGGTFSVNGKSDRGYPISLPTIVFSRSEQKERPASTFDEASHVTIEQANNAIKVSVWTKTTMIARKELRKGEGNGYMCTTEGIAVRGEFPTVHGLAGYVGQTYTLFKVSDGGLVVKSEQTGGGLALIIPTYASESFWYRYPPYHKP